MTIIRRFKIQKISRLSVPQQMEIVIKLLVVVAGYKVACVMYALVKHSRSKEKLMEKWKHLQRLMQLLGKIQKMACITEQKQQDLTIKGN